MTEVHRRFAPLVLLSSALCPQFSEQGENNERFSRNGRPAPGFLNAAELVTLCQLSENLFDRLRHGEPSISGELMDVIMAATAGVRDMLGMLERGAQPTKRRPRRAEHRFFGA